MERRPWALALVLCVPLILVGVVGSGASAHGRKSAGYAGDAPGSVTCGLSATVFFSPRLTDAGGGTDPSRTTGKLTGCTTTDDVVKITGGSLSGSFAPADPATCTDLASLTTPASFVLHWKGLVDGAIGTTTYDGKANFAPSVLTSSTERFSPSGHFDLQLLVPGIPHDAEVTGSFSGGAAADLFTDIPASSLAALCDTPTTGGTGKGIKKVTLNGSITIGASEGTSLDDALVLATNGQQSFCAVQTTGAVRCWGDNSVGELGDGTTTSSSVAMAVTGITKADGIASDGKNSFCTVLTTGVMDCWGENTSGELGNGTTTSSSVPVTVTGITNAISVTSDGEGSYCAVLASGSIACWGSNMSGQLGDGTMTGSSVPVAVTGITNASTVTSDGGGSYCAVLATGIVSCWGANDFGQLGDGSTASSSVPTATGITDAVTVSSDTDSSFCAVLTTGAVECWGANFAGELGDGTTMRSTVPVAVTGITTAVSIADDGAESYCAVLSTGAVACWGLNSFGELGDATTTNSDVPVAVLDITNAASITSDGDDSFCALLTSGSIDCWGANFSGELGNGSSSASSTPVAVSDITTATDVSGGIHPAGDTEHAYCAVVIAAEVDCWGSNKFGELGNATTIASPVPVTVVQP